MINPLTGTIAADLRTRLVLFLRDTWLVAIDYTRLMIRKRMRSRRCFFSIRGVEIATSLSKYGSSAVFEHFLDIELTLHQSQNSLFLLQQLVRLMRIVRLSLLFQQTNSIRHLMNAMFDRILPLSVRVHQLIPQAFALLGRPNDVGTGHERFAWNGRVEHVDNVVVNFSRTDQLFLKGKKVTTVQIRCNRSHGFRFACRHLVQPLPCLSDSLSTHRRSIYCLVGNEENFLTQNRKIGCDLYEKIACKSVFRGLKPISVRSALRDQLKIRLLVTLTDLFVKIDKITVCTLFLVSDRLSVVRLCVSPPDSDRKLRKDKTILFFFFATLGFRINKNGFVGLDFGQNGNSACDQEEWKTAGADQKLAFLFECPFLNPT